MLLERFPRVSGGLYGLLMAPWIRLAFPRTLPGLETNKKLLYAILRAMQGPYDGFYFVGLHTAEKFICLVFQTFKLILRALGSANLRALPGFHFV